MIARPYRRLAPLTLALLAASLVPQAQASSHREAPFITRQPKVDATDFYAFRSYEAGRSGHVTLIANYLPLQDAYGGPNYFALDPEALYEIHIDNNGDAVEDLTYQFRFKQTLQDLKVNVGGMMMAVPLLNIGSILAGDDSALNVRETFTVTQVKGPRRGTGARQALLKAGGSVSVFEKPVDNIGTKSLPDYAAYANQYIHSVTVPGCAQPARLFVGQRKDSFAVNLGGTFDLVNIAAPATEFDAQAEDKGLDALADKNVTTLALELPISCITNGSESVIGAWTSASLRQGRLLNPAPAASINSASREGGAWSQVSRLGMPLVNEVVIGLKDKDRFNTSQPRNDAQFLSYVTNPTLPALLEILFSSAGVQAPTNFPRNDLVTAFLTGVPGLNQPANVRPAEVLRLNTGILPVAADMQQRLGVIGGDTAGFPNGRRPGDDVVDIALRVVMGKLCKLELGCAPADAPSGNLHFTDGALQTASQFTSQFPYLTTPIPGAGAGL
ncbi:MAG: DUF4331 domain-containing protein [Pseudomonadota bacterium]